MHKMFVRAGGDRNPRLHRSFAHKFASIGVAVALIGVPTVIAAPAAYAADTLMVTAPAEGSTISAFVPSFSGEGVNADDTITITYVNGDGDTSSATRFGGDPTVGGDLTWFTPTNFQDLAPDQTAVTVTVTELAADGSPVSAPVVRSFNFSEPPNPANPFMVTSPTAGSTVNIFTPTFTGTANPGETISVSVGNTDFTTFVAGTATVDANGNFSTVLDLNDVVQDADGETNVGLNTTRISANGVPYPNNDGQNVLINFAPPAPAMLTVDQPAQGATVSPFVPSFSGMGINAGDEIEITYVNGAGETQSATRFIGNTTVEDDLTWFAPTNFEDLAPDQTDITVTVTEIDADGITVGVPVIRSFSFSSPPNPANEFRTTSPGVGSTVDTFTPTLTGTANPGEQITVTVGNTDFTTAVVGQVTVNDNGTFSTVLDLSDVVQDADGSTDVRFVLTRTAADGSAVADDTRFLFVVFEPIDQPPFVPNEPAITIVPDRITVSDSMNPEKGVLVTATGFNQNEEVEVTLTAPDGTTIQFSAAALEALGGADETGTFAAPVFLFGQPVLGTYMISVTGVDSAVELSDSFELIANPVAPTVPAGNTTLTGTSTLAATGFNGTPYAGLSALLILAGAALIGVRRLARTRATTE
ncbi:MAG: hypothetical protein H7201_18895 [Candidatus Saccharibacteria bacterium]|nr:hypothetical protein [Microbacteriaceae bacterium]